MSDRVQQIAQAGQSIWLDFLGRDLLQSGRLAALARDRQLTGITSNPSIFLKAITGSDLYASDIHRLAHDGVTGGYEAFVALASRDISDACDILLPVYDATNGRDGLVSFELPPGIANDVEASVAEAIRLWALIDRPNLMIKVPGTAAGVEILALLVAAGLNINQTLLFSVDVYERTVDAYLRGLEARLDRGMSITRIASVASFFVSRVDTAVDAALPEGSALRGRAAIANAREAYRRFLGVFSGSRWQRLAAAGAVVQRPLWASTSTKNPAYRDVRYVETLIAPDTVNTLPEPTLGAVQDHCEVRIMSAEEINSGQFELAQLRDAGIDIGAVTDRLLAEGLAAFERDFQALLAAIESSLAPAATGA
jgi:transaldolase